MIRTVICDMLGIEYPLFQGGMAWVADGGLAAAVSEGGGLGIIGAGNMDGEMVRKQIPAADIAKYCLNSITAVLTAMTKDAARQSGNLPVLYAGGVLSDRLIQAELRKLPLQTAFAAPEFSCDNAAGIAIYAARKENPSCLF